jgi:xanthine dehydrogenase YagS FAD-binding subunit
MAALGLNLQVRGGVIEDARVVFGGIAGKPWREKAVEELLKGKMLGPGAIDQVVPTALADAAPLKYNAMKIEMAKGLLASGLEKLRTSA